MPGNNSKMINALSIDVEDYFHVEAFANQISPADWQKFNPRVERNVERILQILSDHHTNATFFVLGYVAKRFPQIAQRIANAGHEIGCHGYAHQHIQRQTPKQFREDIRIARGFLTDQVQRSISCYRAPTFSITKSTLWALEILAEEGFTIDSSIFPVHHDLYGMPDAERFPHWIDHIFEFPLTTVRWAHSNIGVGGGGYLRFLPYRFTRWAIRKVNRVEKQPAMVYFHPWELDPDQPRIAASLRSRLRHYTNLKSMQGKVERLLKDFRFSTVSEVCKGLIDTGSPSRCRSNPEPQTNRPATA
jgi:polysaccharide deacetylase family protein (PEP-CTERM system associated)